MFIKKLIDLAENNFNVLSKEYIKNLNSMEKLQEKSKSTRILSSETIEKGASNLNFTNYLVSSQDKMTLMQPNSINKNKKFSEIKKAIKIRELLKMSNEKNNSNTSIPEIKGMLLREGHSKPKFCNKNIKREQKSDSLIIEMKKKEMKLAFAHPSNRGLTTNNKLKNIVANYSSKHKRNFYIKPAK